MKTLEIKLYSFDELSKDAQQKVISNHAEMNVNFDWWEFIYEDAANIGLKLTGFDIDRSNYCHGEFTLSAHEVAANIISTHGETCETYKTAQTFLDGVNSVKGGENDEYGEGEEYESEMMELENEFLNSLLEDYRIMLQHEYEYQTSEEAIIETIKANEYTFEANGEMKNF